MRLQLFLLISLLTVPALSQTKEIESLLQKAKNTTGQEKIQVLNEIAKNFSSIDPRQGIKYGNEALQLAEALKKPSLKSTVYLNIGINYLRLSQKDTARILFNTALRNALLFHDSLATALYYNRMGLLYEFEGKYDSSIYVFRKELEIYRTLKNEARTATTLENLGTISLNRGEFKSATSYLLEAKSVFEKTGDKSKLLYIYMKLGQVFSETRDFQDAEKWFQKAVDGALEMDDPIAAGFGLNSLGIVYKKQGRYDAALEKFQAALVKIQNMTNYRLLLSIYANMGNVYLSLKKPLEAISYHTKSLDLAQKLKSPGPIAVQQFSLGLDHFNLKNYSIARSYYEKALPVFTSMKSNSDLLQTYTSLIDVNKALGDFKQSVGYYELLTQLKDSLNREELNSALDSLKVKLHTAETDRENILLKRETELKAKTIRQQRTIILSSLLFFLLLGAFIVYIIQSRQRIKKLNGEYLELLKFKDTMTHFLVHDLKNALNTIVNIEPGSIEPGGIVMIKNSGRRMLNLVLNLLDIGKFESSRMELDLKSSSVNALINSACLQMQYQAGMRSVRFGADTLTDYQIVSDPGILERVLINLLDNAIRYSEMGTTIEITKEVVTSVRLCIAVKDHGRGIPADLLSRLFTKYTTGEMIQVGASRSFGLGLTFCKWAMEAQQGDISIVSEEGKGTTVMIFIPLAVNQDPVVAPDNLSVKPDSGDPGVILTPEEALQLKPYCERLKLQRVHQITDIKDILNEIDQDHSPGIAAWKRLLLGALNDCNQIRYNELMNITE